MPYRARQSAAPTRNFERSRRRMVAEQIEARGVANPLVLAAMRQVPRHLFVQEALEAHAYDDATLPIGYGQTISQPYTVARMCELCEPERGLRVLEVGAGCGYQMAVIAAMGCVVYGIERVRQIFEATTMRLRRMGLRHAHTHCGDGTLGFPPAAPFDRIIVSAGGPEIPEPLIKQLGNGGIMVIPVGQERQRQRLVRVRKLGDEIQMEDLGATVFVDLIGSHGWR